MHKESEDAEEQLIVFEEDEPRAPQGPPKKRSRTHRIVCEEQEEEEGEDKGEAEGEEIDYPPVRERDKARPEGRNEEAEDCNDDSRDGESPEGEKGEGSTEARSSEKKRREHIMRRSKLDSYLDRPSSLWLKLIVNRVKRRSVPVKKGNQQNGHKSWCRAAFPIAALINYCEGYYLLLNATDEVIGEKGLSPSPSGRQFRRVSLWSSYDPPYHNSTTLDKYCEEYRRFQNKHISGKGYVEGPRGPPPSPSDPSPSESVDTGEPQSSVPAPDVTTQEGDAPDVGREPRITASEARQGITFEEAVDAIAQDRMRLSQVFRAAPRMFRENREELEYYQALSDEGRKLDEEAARMSQSSSTK